LESLPFFSEMSEQENTNISEVEAVAADDKGEETDDAQLDGDDEREHVAMSVDIITDYDDGEEDEVSIMEDPTENHDDEDDITVKSTGTDDEMASTSSPKPPKSVSTPENKSGKRSPRRSSVTGSSAKKGRTPSVAGLTIPFRTVKKAMKLDPDIPIVQNEAAIMTTVAAELFLKRLAKESHRNAKNRGRNTIRYEDVAEARTKSSALAFLETLLP
jgi:histone H3/H4